MNNRITIQRLVVIASFAIAMTVILILAFVQPGGAQENYEQLFRGNFGVALTTLPEKDQQFLEVVLATEEAAAAKYPTAVPFATHEAWPTPPPRPTGILWGPAALPGFFYTTNLWQGLVDSNYVQVFPVSRSWDRSKWWLYVDTVSDSSEGSVPAPVWYELPVKAGVYTITEAKDLSLTIGTSDNPKETVVFDVGKRTLEYPLGATAVPAVVVPQPLPEEVTLPGPEQETAVPSTPQQVQK